MINFRTDLALERRDLFKKANNISNEVDGLETQEESFTDDIKISRVKVLNDNGEQAIGKRKGTYITIDIKNLKIAGEDEIQKASEAVTKELKNLIGALVDPQEDILVVGLGNLYVTPDALGPKVVNEIDITRHLLNYMPDVLDKDTRPVSAIAPGVLGTTGIETLEVIKGIVENIHPKLIIVIDALASRSIERISSTVQLADTGIVPGAGVENKRKEISKKTLGIPVIAIGIPTVVDLATVTNECIDIFIENLQEKAMSNDYLNKLKEKDNYEDIKEALVPKDYNMIVTPKEVDDLIENMKNIVAKSINYAI